jgi:hypothetical protein
MIYLPKLEQAWQLLSDHQKKLYPLEMFQRFEKKYPQSNVVYLDIDCFRLWDSSRTDYMEVL